MPIHDWSRVDAGVFHDFHQAWTIGIINALNAGGLPAGLFAIVENAIVDRCPIPHVMELPPSRSTSTPAQNGADRLVGIAVADAPPKARFVASAEQDAPTQPGPTVS